MATKLAHPDLEFVSHLAAVDGRTYRGVDGTRAYYEDLREVWQEWHNELRSLTEVESNTVITENVFRGTGRSGVQVENASALVWTLLDRRVFRLRSYATRAEALAAVGLSG